MSEEEKEKIDVDEVRSKAIEEIAMKLGYNPDFDGDDKEYKTPEEFILNSKDIQKTMSKQKDNLSKKVDSMRAELEENRRMAQGLRKHFEALNEATVAGLKSRINELEGQRQAALDEEDHTRVRKIDEQIDDLEKVSNKKVEEDAPIPPEFKAWVADNEWYYEDEELRTYANAQVNNNPKFIGMTQKMVYKTIEKDVKEAFPEKFQSEKVEKEPEKKPKAPSVEGATRKSSKSAKFTVKDLTEEQRTIGKDFEKQGIMTMEEYINDLVKIGQLS